MSRDPPFLLLSLGNSSGFKSDEQVMGELRDGDPSILALCRNKVLWVNVTTLGQGQDVDVARRIRDVLS